MTKIMHEEKQHLCPSHATQCHQVQECHQRVVWLSILGGFGDRRHRERRTENVFPASHKHPAAERAGAALMKTLSDAEYAELLRRGTTCASCLNYQRLFDAHRDCEFWQEGDETETWGEAKVRAQTRPICRNFRSTDWRLSHPLGSSRGRSK